MRKNKIVALITILVSIALLSIFLILRYSKPSDQQAYEEIVATMSMEKAKRFFYEYPKSNFRDKLINEIIEWCKKEETEECYKIILDTIPKDHMRYKELSAYYEEHFNQS